MKVRLPWQPEPPEELQNRHRTKLQTKEDKWLQIKKRKHFNLTFIEL